VFINDTALPGTASGGTGNDYLEAGTVGNTLNGGDGNDILVGYKGNDLLVGGLGSDYLFGLAGNDNLQGGTGNDYTYGGAGSDYVYDYLGTNVKDGLTDGPLDSKTAGLRSQKLSDYLTSTITNPNTGNLSAIELAIVGLVNQERAKVGLAPLSVNSKLVAAAQHHAQNMATFDVMAHTIPQADLPSFLDRLNYFQYSYRLAGENIAWNYQSAADVMDGWMNSSGHRANILNANFTQIGVGVRYNSFGEPYYCQDFGQPM
jgi:uncharacterized protein YkwD